MRIYTDTRFQLTARELYRLVRERYPDVDRIVVESWKASNRGTGRFRILPLLYCYDRHGVCWETLDDFDLEPFVVSYLESEGVGFTRAGFELSWEPLLRFMHEALPESDDVVVIDGRLVS